MKYYFTVYLLASPRIIPSTTSSLFSTAIFSTGYGYLSKMAWPLGILPAIIILPIRIYYLKKSGGKYDYPAKAERQ